MTQIRAQLYWALVNPKTGAALGLIPARKTMPPDQWHEPNGLTLDLTMTSHHPRVAAGFDVSDCALASALPDFILSDNFL